MYLFVKLLFFDTFFATFSINSSVDSFSLSTYENSDEFCHDSYTPSLSIYSSLKKKGIKTSPIVPYISEKPFEYTIEVQQSFNNYSNASYIEAFFEILLKEAYTKPYISKSTS